jgi:hypothetical protein
MPFPGSVHHAYRWLLGDDDYKPLPVNPLVDCCWLHEGPACSCHVGNGVFCTECGHEVDCHETVRVSL